MNRELSIKILRAIGLWNKRMELKQRLIPNLWVDGKHYRVNPRTLAIKDVTNQVNKRAYSSRL